MITSEGRGERQTLHVGNKFAIAVVFSLVIVTGLTPALLILKLLRFWPLAFLGSLVLIAAAFFFFRRPVFRAPAFSEVLLAGFGRIFIPALLGSAGLLVYAILYGAILAIRWIGGNLEIGTSQGAATPAAWVAVLTVGLLGIPLVLAMAKELISELYPETAGLRSSFHKTRIGRSCLVTKGLVFILIYLIGILWGIILERNRFPVFLYYLLQADVLFMGYYLLRLTRGERPPRIGGEVEAVGEVLKKRGYEVEINPRFHDPGIDPLLLNLSLHACKGDRHLYIGVCQERTAEEQPIWAQALKLKQSAFVFSRKRGYLPPSVDDVILVLMDAKADKTLKIQNEATVIAVKSNGLSFSGFEQSPAHIATDRTRGDWLEDGARTRMASAPNRTIKRFGQPGRGGGHGP